ncbi:MAG TPA: hypothetical protein VGO84_06610 [Burkholderiales bacterium]|jgi:hypothetical protein|nr:hypothetical protein [Burkholderiales bacterium]
MFEDDANSSSQSTTFFYASKQEFFNGIGPNAAFRDRLMESGHRRMYQAGKTAQRQGVAA